MPIPIEYMRAFAVAVDLLARKNPKSEIGSKLDCNASQQLIDERIIA